MEKKILLLSLVFLFSFSFSPGKFVYPQEDTEKQVIESLEFREVDIKDILRQLAKQYNLNIVFSENVKSLVTVQLNNVTVEQALDSIITVNGFSYTKKENVYKVATQEEAQREGKQTKLFKLNNADALKLKDTLVKVLTAEGAIEADSRSNSILVTDSLTSINKIEQMMSVLDELTPQVLIEARLIETSLTNNENLGIDWNTQITAQGAKRQITFPFDPLGAGITDQNQWYRNFFPSSNPTDSNFTSNSSFAFPYVNTTSFTFGTLDFTSLTAVFKILKSRTDTKLIANPRIVTINNQKATINVGKVIPIATYQMDSTTGNWQVTGWENINVGINLEVTPQISPDGHIRLKLKPEVSSEVGTISPNTVNQRPVISTRTAETEVQIRDGQTVVIAGLVKSKDYTSVSKIPILGDIPFIGYLFKRKDVGTSTEPKEKTDLMIFVTARIMKDNKEPMVGWDTNLLSSPPRPFKLESRKVK
ncbi:MAG: secretin and TonB N-terminal domain-containing protein [Candidatus Omnitrophica bacterium]|nr:secretin and TonB N-terminal domain-containing protein [Candidatus Omnitrophota bacterium]